MPQLHNDLLELVIVPSGFERRLQFVALLSKRLPETHQPVVVGGHALEWHTLAEYTTGDVDLVVDNTSEVVSILQQWGFVQQGRVWWHPDLDLVVDLIDERLAGDRSRITKAETADGVVDIIGVEDLIVDRLNACIHWKSEADCQWVEHLLRQHGPKCDWDYLQQRCVEEATADQLNELWRRARDAPATES